MTETRKSHVAVFQGAGQAFELKQLDVPEPGPGEAIVQVELSTICGSDVHTVSGRRSEAVPCILGHEAIGTIVEIGTPAPQDLSDEPVVVGDRVTWSACISCGECDRCRGGLTQKCRTVRKYGHSVATGRHALSGGLSEFLLLSRGSCIVKLDRNLPAEVACPANCATSTVMAAFRPVGELIGKRVLVLGAGMLGLTAAAIADSRGAESIVLSDPDETRLKWAREFGALPLPGNISDTGLSERPDVIIECSGSEQAVQFALTIGAVGAHVVLLGSVLPSRDVQLDPEFVVRNLHTIRGVHNYVGDDLSDAVEFLTHASDRYPFAGLVEATFPLRDVQDAFRYAQEHRPIRVAIKP